MLSRDKISMNLRIEQFARQKFPRNREKVLFIVLLYLHAACFRFFLGKLEGKRLKKTETFEGFEGE
jgi:hypothetical protein